MQALQLAAGVWINFYMDSKYAFTTNRLGLRLKVEIFYQKDGESLLMAALSYLSHWLPHLSSSSTKELIQGGQPSRPSWPSIFMSPRPPV
jgi:hypothetical protein